MGTEGRGLSISDFCLPYSYRRRQLRWPSLEIIGILLVLLVPFVDDYRTKCIGPRPSFRLILEEVQRLELAVA